MFVAVTAMENVAVSWIIQHGKWSQVILKKKKGSTYDSSVQVGSGLSRFVDNFPILFTAKKNVSQLLLYTNENWENQLLYLFYLFWVLTWA